MGQDLCSKFNGCLQNEEISIKMKYKNSLAGGRKIPGGEFSPSPACKLKGVWLLSVQHLYAKSALCPGHLFPLHLRRAQYVRGFHACDDGDDLYLSPVARQYSCAPDDLGLRVKLALYPFADEVYLFETHILAAYDLYKRARRPGVIHLKQRMVQRLRDGFFRPVCAVV